MRHEEKANREINRLDFWNTAYSTRCASNGSGRNIPRLSHPTSGRCVPNVNGRSLDNLLQKDKHLKVPHEENGQLSVNCPYSENLFAPHLMMQTGLYPVNWTKSQMACVAAAEGACLFVRYFLLALLGKARLCGALPGTHWAIYALLCSGS